MKMDQYREVDTCGRLYTSTGQEYFLLSPHPANPDSWQNHNQQRFVCVPIEPVGVLKEGKKVYSHARYVITTNPTIEYVASKESICIMQGELDKKVPPAPEEFQWPEGFLTIEEHKKRVEASKNVK